MMINFSFLVTTYKTRFNVVAVKVTEGRPVHSASISNGYARLRSN